MEKNLVPILDIIIQKQWVDLVKIGINGELFDPGDVKQLVKHLVKLIEDGEKRVKMGKKSTELAQGYDWKNIAQSYSELYEQVIKIEK